MLEVLLSILFFIVIYILGESISFDIHIILRKRFYFENFMISTMRLSKHLVMHYLNQIKKD
jgi:hypothetical protein